MRTFTTRAILAALILLFLAVLLLLLLLVVFLVIGVVDVTFEGIVLPWFTCCIYHSRLQLSSSTQVNWLLVHLHIESGRKHSLTNLTIASVNAGCQVNLRSTSQTLYILATLRMRLHAVSRTLF